MMYVDNGDIEVLDYSFTKNEVFLLAKFLRVNEESLPEGLENIYKTLLDSVYNTLSLEEVKQFFS